MRCVNRKSKEFKYLAEHNDVDLLKLEQITHKYWLETGNEDAFPSDVYIQAQKGIGKYQEDSKAVRELWQKVFSEPKEYSTLEELNTAKQEASKYFPEEAISYYKNYKGNFVLRIKEPVKEINLTIKDVIGRYTLDQQELSDFGLIQAAMGIVPTSPLESKPANQLSSQEVWQYMSAVLPLTKRTQIEYSPKGQDKQTYTVENGHIYNKENKEVYPINTPHKTHRNKILANLAIREGRAVVVTNPNNNEKYVVDNNQQITSVATGNIMQWDENNGNRKRILTQAEIKFRERIAAAKEANNTITPQLLDYLQSIGIDIHNREEMIQYLKEHGNKAIQEAIGRFVDKYSLPKGELPALSSALSAKFGNNTAYGDVITTANYEYTVIYRGVEDFDIIEYHKIENNNNEINDRERNKISGVTDRLSSGDEITEGKYQSDNYNASDREADGNYAGLDQEASQGESQQTQSDVSGQEYQGGSELVKTNFNGTNAPRYMHFENTDTRKDWNSALSDTEQQFTTPQGEVYAFAAPNGNLYFDETVISSEHPIHEYTHLWDRVVAKNNPQLWQRGITLMKETSLWKEVENNDNYGKKWKAVEGITESQLESLIASEVHSRLTGVNGEQLLNRIAKEKGSDKIVNKLKQWLLDFWKDLKATFSDWSQEDLDKLTLQDFTTMTIRDFADGFNPNTLQQISAEQTKNSQQSIPASYEGMITPDTNTIFVFGSNPEGRHGAGAAKTAREKFGAIYGQGEGLQGNSYALPTKDLRVKENRGFRSISPEQITENIRRMYEVAKQNPTKQFKVAYTHGLNETSLNGYTGAEMIKMFKDAGTIPSNVVFSKNWTDHWNEVQATEQATQQSTLPGPETKINIYAGTNENADLSNFAEKPFKIKIAADSARFIKIGRRTKNEEETGDINDVIEFKSVEQAFQYFKTLYSATQTPLQQVKELQDKILSTIDGGTLRTLGRQVNLDKFIWDLSSSNIMKRLLKASFEQNPQALQRLLATGNATLTHTQDKGKWGTEFPKLLMEVRDELRGQQQGIQQEQQKLDTLKQDLGGGEQATAEVQDAVKVAKKGMSFEEALAGQEAFFSKEEQAQIKQGLNGKNLQVMSVSRLTDPAFFSKEIVSFLKKNAEKPLNDPTRVTAIEIWSKHDGLPIKDILDACKKYRVAPMVSFSITGLGGTALEGGVMKYQDMLEKVGELIKNGTLNPATITVRIDPILPGVTSMDDIRKIVETAKSYGIKKFVTSLVQSYGYTEGTPRDRKVVSGINNALVTEGKTYDWDKYYGRDRNGKINFKPKQEVINEIGKVLLELDNDPEITIQTCAFGIKGLKVSACLDPMIIERITGVDVLRKDGTYDRDTSRPECMCYGCHGDFFKGQNKKCYSSCAYCYAAHSGDNKLNYYNEDGTLKDNDYTRTERVQTLQQQTQRVETVESTSSSATQEETQAPFEVNINPEHATLTEEQQQDINQQLDDFDKINQQVDALNENAILSSVEVIHIAELVFNAFSDMITEIQNNKGRAQELFPSLGEDNFDYQSATRKEIINHIGIGKLLDGIKTKYFDTESMSDEVFSELTASDEQKINEVFNNWDGVLTFGTDIFSMNEGFGLRRNRKGGRYELTNGMHIGYESYNGWEDPDAVREEEDEQEHWQVEQKTIDILTSASELVRRAIHECYLMKNGEKVLKYGIPERVNPRKAIQSILTWTVGSQSLNEMVTRLQAKVDTHPWIEQLVARLSDTSGNETDLQSQFFTTMCKSKQLYAKGVKEKNEYSVIPVNEHPASSDIREHVFGMVQAHAHPLFQGENNRISESYLGRADKVSTNDEMSLHRALYELKQLQEAHKNDRDDEQLNEIEKKLAKDLISSVCKIIGFEPQEEILDEVVAKKSDVIGFGRYENGDGTKSMLDALQFIVNNLDNARKAQLNNKLEKHEPLTYGAKYNIGGDVSNFLRPITDIMDETVPNVVFSDGKLYQGYTTPSYLTLLIEKFHWDNNKFNEFIAKEYKKSEWFFDKNGRARTPWLNLLTNPNGQRFELKHKVELSFNKHAYMKRMTPEEYNISIIANYFSEYNPDSNEKNPLMWFKMPIMSNKPSSEFLRFYAEMGSDYKDNITKGLFQVYLQELSRIQTVGMRNLSKNDPDFIKNWDKNGAKFCFLPFLNSYLKGARIGDYLQGDENNRLATLLQTVVDRKELSVDDQAELNKLILNAIKEATDRKCKSVLDEWTRTGITEEAKKIKNILPKEYKDGKGEGAEAARTAYIKEQLLKYLWNDHYANINILELTVGDIAAYKNAEDLQKRLAELHAPGSRPNKKSTDYKGKPVSDGTYRTLLLQDWNDFKSNLIANIAEICDRRIEAAPDSQKPALKAWKEDLVRPPKTYGEDDLGGIYWKINVADAQAYSSPSSYRKKAFMFGRWSKKAEDVYNRLLQGDFNIDELEVAFQPLKPFVYSQIMQDVGIRGEVNSPIQNMPIPFQAKNAEYLLVMADAIIRGAERNGIQTGKPCLLRAIYDVMEESERLNPTKGIDTVQFTSAIKSGLQGSINLHEYANDRYGEAKARVALKNAIYLRDNEDNLTKNYNTRTYIKEADYSTYCLQQEVPDHFINHSQAQGSQERMIIPSDLDMYDYNGKVNSYTWTDPDGRERSETADVVRQEYETPIANNILTDLEVVKEQLGLNKPTKRERNIALSKILQNEISDSPRYGTELFQACSVDKQTGEFKIPKGDPTQVKRIEQLINSFIKNGVNKQEMPGGPIVQVSNFGTSKQLHIRFHDKQGGILMTEEEFNRVQEQKKEKGAYKDTDGKDIVMYRGYALTEDREAVNLEETIGHTAVDYDDSLKGALYFTSSREEAEDYAKTRTDKSNETFERNGEIITQRNRHYTGDYAKVSAYKIKESAKVERYKDMKDYVKHGKGTDADVIILERGTMWSDNSEYIILNKDAVISTKKQSYQQYCKDNQAGIAYFEVFAPAWMKELYTYFTDRDGNIDIEAIELIAPDMLKLISYRIPTEDKYSIAPMKIVGFLPKEAGSAVMFPYELTGIDGSDYDVDKRYVIRKLIELAVRFEIKEGENVTEAEKSYIKHNRKSITRELKKAVNLKARYDSKEARAIRKEAEEQAAFEKKALDRAYDTGVYNENKYEKELAKLEDRKEKTIEDAMSRLVDEKIIQFLKEDRFLPTSQDDALTRELRKAYYNYMFKPMAYSSGKYANDAKVFDITWGILTNEMTADKILNPGGFDNYKRMAYTVAAYKTGKYTWEELQGKSIDELKDLSDEEKDLTYIDTQLQFYKQNAAAASLIGVFAVHKIAHAILQGDGILLDIHKVCKIDRPFSIAGFTFGGYRDANGNPLMSEQEFIDYQEHGHNVQDHVEYSQYIKDNADFYLTGRMEIDKKEDSNGNLIGRTLGSGVGASADAAKDPCLDQMNINMTTVNILNTMLRLGMPLESATLFTSQNIISNLLSEFNKQNLSGYTSLDDILDDWIDNIREEMDIGDNSESDYEPLDEKELINGLLPNHPSRTDYKVLLAFKRIKLLADKMRNPTFITRFNSISAATGPLVLDNIIAEQKVKDFTSGTNTSEEDGGTGFYDREGNDVDASYIFEKHPILEAFYRTFSVAKDLFHDTPAGSEGFRKLINDYSEGLEANGILNKVLNDKKIFDKLLNFYTTYLMVQEGLINPDETATIGGKQRKKLEWYINEFPKYFMDQKYKEKYKDNPFIQAISVQGSRRTGRAFLNIPITGMEETEKSLLRAAWTDLHKKDPALSIRLATYWVFRGGIGFSPKTGTSLIPNYVKLHWNTTKPDGSTISYNDVYRKLNGVPPKIVIDQFIRNNWNDNKLVPLKKGNKNDYHYSTRNGVGRLEVTGDKAIKGLNNIVWMKTSFNRMSHLWKLAYKTETSLVFTEVKSLGDNNEYLEMSTNMIDKPIHNTVSTIADQEESEFTTTSASESSASEKSKTPTNSAQEENNISQLATMVYDLYTSRGIKFSKERAQKAVDAYRSGDEWQKKVWGNTIREAIELATKVKIDENNLDKEVEKYCD